MPTPLPYYCPRDCHRDRTYPTIEKVKEHVARQHPDHDPLWFETYPWTDQDPPELAAGV